MCTFIINSPPIKSSAATAVAAADYFRRAKTKEQFLPVISLLTQKKPQALGDFRYDKVKLMSKPKVRT